MVSVNLNINIYINKLNWKYYCILLYIYIECTNHQILDRLGDEWLAVKACTLPCLPATVNKVYTFVSLKISITVKAKTKGISSPFYCYYAGQDPLRARKVSRKKILFFIFTAHLFFKGMK